MWIRDLGWKKFRFGIREEHPGSATLIITFGFIIGDELLRASLQAALLPGAAGHASQPVQVQVSLRFNFSTLQAPRLPGAAGHASQPVQVQVSQLRFNFSTRRGSVGDSGHFGADPDPRIRSSD
jgi:hypothetical protein